MKEFKGTSGLWTLANNDYGYYTSVRSFDSDRKICVSRVNNLQESNANLVLISKAPEMLDMLIEMKSAMLELMNHQDGWEDDYTKLCELIESATNLK